MRYGYCSFIAKVIFNLILLYVFNIALFIVFASSLVFVVEFHCNCIFVQPRTTDSYVKYLILKHSTVAVNKDVS